jgi:hypothetical protein
MTTPLPWSHSSINGFETCPRQYAEVKVLKHYKQKSNDASIWGDEAHTAFEKYLKGEANLEPRFETYKTYLDKYKALPGNLFAERMYALDKRLQPCDFYAPGVWGRGIIDVLVINGFHALVDDHKTGKRKKDMQQLVIFALLVFYHHPEVQVCDVGFQWLKTNEEDREVFQRADIPMMWNMLVDKLGRYAEAFHRGIFPAKPSGLCKQHCPVDTCEYFQVGMYRR